MRYFIDTEFHEEQNSLELISIGIVCEDGRKLYRVSSDYDEERATDWLEENVLPHLPLPMSRMPRSTIAEDIKQFCNPEVHGKPEFWGYYADYDWVVFCWLFGSMIDLPEGYPMYCRDIKQLADSLGNPPLPKQKKKAHDALADAEHHKVMFDYLVSYSKQGVSQIKVVPVDSESHERKG